MSKTQKIVAILIGLFITFCLMVYFFKDSMKEGLEGKFTPLQAEPKK